MEQIHFHSTHWKHLIWELIKSFIFIFYFYYNLGEGGFSPRPRFEPWAYRCILRPSLDRAYKELTDGYFYFSLYKIVPFSFISSTFFTETYFLVHFSVYPLQMLVMKGIFCSKLCAVADWETFHSLLCTGERSESVSRKALLEFIQHANGKMHSELPIFFELMLSFCFAILLLIWHLSLCVSNGQKLMIYSSLLQRYVLLWKIC